MTEERKHLYKFGEFRLDPDERRLLRRGDVVALTPKSFDLLLALLQNPGRLMEKELLLKTVWPDSFVEENNLADNISRLRKALGEGENGQKFIETVPKRGYRFVAELSQQAATEPAIDAGPHAASSAVLPRNTTPRFRALLLVVLAGAVLAGSAVWLNSWIKTRAEVYRLGVRGDFYASKWTEPEIRKGIEFYKRAIALDPDSASAYAGLAAGWNFLSDLHVSPREAMPQAKAAALKALEIDDSLATAHVSLGVVRMQYEWDWAGAEREFQRAIQLEPEHSPGHRLHAWYLMAMGLSEEAKTVLRRTLESDPLSDSNLWELGLAFYFARQYDGAVEQYRRAMGVERTSHWPPMLLGWAYAEQGKFGEAASQLNQAFRLNDNPQVLASLGYVYARSGQRAAAEKVLAELVQTGRRYVSPYDIATIYAGLGEKQQALAWLEKAYEERCGWLAWWLKVDPKFEGVRSEARFQELLRRVGHQP